MRPCTCETCGGSGHDPVTSRRLPCANCKGNGFEPTSIPTWLKEMRIPRGVSLPGRPNAPPAYILETLKEAGLD